MIADNVYVEDVGIGRAVVRAPLDVDTDLGILYGNVMDRGLSARIDRRLQR